mmetsp:Transcript_138013/g.327009  ORF Transcript_138013/g.327009 Transcript_138013/m.327009 type:complete len:319 (+) Transcript_138013:74-1030(+)
MSLLRSRLLRKLRHRHCALLESDREPILRNHVALLLEAFGNFLDDGLGGLPRVEEFVALRILALDDVGLDLVLGTNQGPDLELALQRLQHLDLQELVHIGILQGLAALLRLLDDLSASLSGLNGPDAARRSPCWQGTHQSVCDRLPPDSIEVFLVALAEANGTDPLLQPEDILLLEVQLLFRRHDHLADVLSLSGGEARNATAAALIFFRFSSCNLLKLSPVELFVGDAQFLGLDLVFPVFGLRCQLLLLSIDNVPPIWLLGICPASLEGVRAEALRHFQHVPDLLAQPRGEPLSVASKVLRSDVLRLDPMVPLLRLF